ncbi:MAG TPA: 16S rRNA (cytidine(1402)-2'-O)-methyltransferase, partial [Actinomycetota bacterium]|nr:16S rRNA (cytidine(1402)-2'-O)-methyltransferase [Actinomycetota bacterium]
MTGRLYVCATPIGNLEDVTLRLLRVLGEVDLVAAEDTRRAAKLLAAHGIHARTVSYHDANERSRLPELMEQLQGGRRVALVTDAGMPSVSDPGYHLVSACREVGVPVEVVPGPSAVLTALVASGLPPARFAFEGFLPRKPGDRSRRLQAIAGDDRTLVFFEAPGRLAETLGAMAEVFGPRRAAVARELTKLHEEVVRGSLPELAEAFGSGPVRGEITVVVEGAVPGRGDLRRALAAA